MNNLMEETKVPNDTTLIYLTAKQFRQLQREENEKLIEAISNIQPEFVKSSAFRKIFEMGESKLEQLVRDGIVKCYATGGLYLYDVKAFRMYLLNKCEVVPERRR